MKDLDISAESAPEESGAPRFSARSEALLLAGLALLVLLPCFWQERIHAGDLSSHLYNAWLALQVKAGLVDGLVVVPQWTNVLCDWIMEFLGPRIGWAWTERVLASVVVSVFFWGAFYLIGIAAGRRPWIVTPFLMMISYGLIFHFGFFNFYLSAGLGMWIVGLGWSPTPRRIGWMVPLSFFALLAHPLGVVWAFSVLAYVQVFRRASASLRLLMPPVALLALYGLHLWLRSYPNRWSWSQTFSQEGLLGITGVEQVWLYDGKYILITVALLALWVMLFLDRMDRMTLTADVAVHIWALHLMAFALLPSAIQFPQYTHVLAYIPQRISLFIGICFCLVVAEVPHGRGITRLAGVLAVIFFSFLFADERQFTRVETELATIYKQVPDGARAVAELEDSTARLNPLSHMGDRACIGRCYSFANYEPATAQFRIRIEGGTVMAAPNMEIVDELRRGVHRLTASEAPVYAACGCQDDEGALCLRELHAGERVCTYSQPVSVSFLE